MCGGEESCAVPSMKWLHSLTHSSNINNGEMQTKMDQVASLAEGMTDRIRRGNPQRISWSRTEAKGYHSMTETPRSLLSGEGTGWAATLKRDRHITIWTTQKLLVTERCRIEDRTKRLTENGGSGAVTRLC